MRVLVLTGGDINLSWANEFIQKRNYETIIAADRGLEAADALNLKVNLLVGDFDSVKKEVLEKYSDVETRKFPEEKDDTDTEIALRAALEYKPESGPFHIEIIGGFGSRMDHVLTNLNILKIGVDAGVDVRLYDKYNCIYLRNKPFAIRVEHRYGDFVSFVPYTDSVVMSLAGFKYPLALQEIKKGDSLLQSNVITGRDGIVDIQKGILVCCEAKEI